MSVREEVIEAKKQGLCSRVEALEAEKKSLSQELARSRDALIRSMSPARLDSEGEGEEGEEGEEGQGELDAMIGAVRRGMPHPHSYPYPYP